MNTDPRKVKQLQSQLNIMIADAEVLKIELGNINREYNSKLQQIQKLKDTIKTFNGSAEITVSEHAILRYLERVKGINISEIESEILTPEVLSFIEKLGGSGKYPVNGFKIVMKDNTVLTIV